MCEASRRRPVWTTAPSRGARSWLGVLLVALALGLVAPVASATGEPERGRHAAEQLWRAYPLESSAPAERPSGSAAGSGLPRETAARAPERASERVPPTGAAAPGVALGTGLGALAALLAAVGLIARTPAPRAPGAGSATGPVAPRPPRPDAAACAADDDTLDSGRARHGAAMRGQQVRRPPPRPGSAGETMTTTVPDRAGSPESPPRRPFDAAFLVRLAIACTAIVVVAVLSAVAFASLGHKVYGARVDMLYAVAPDTSDDARQRILSTQRELVLSRAVLGPVAQQARMPLEDLQAATQVEVGLDDLLHITVGNRDPQRALALVAGVSSRYQALSADLSPEELRGRQLLEEQVRRLSAQAAGASGADAVELRDRIGRLQDRILDLQVSSLSRARPERLTAAYLLDEPLSPKLLPAIALGLLVGLVVAAATGLLLARRRWLAVQAA
jgi:capsular polysaccharide biosynthesis protein